MYFSSLISQYFFFLIAKLNFAIIFNVTVFKNLHYVSRKNEYSNIRT